MTVQTAGWWIAAQISRTAAQIPLTACAGLAFEEFAKPMFDRCISIVTQQLAGRVAAAAGQPVEPEPEREFIICSLDVIAGKTLLRPPTLFFLENTKKT